MSLLYSPISELPYSNIVYLVGTAAEQSRMGGVANRVYITAQDWYNAAVALGGSVLMQAGKVTAAQVGGIVLTASWPSNLSMVGISRTDSVIGTITGTSAFSININALNVTIGNMTSIAGISGTLTNCTAGIVSTLSAVGASGAINLTLVNSTTGNHTATSSFAGGNTGAITISGVFSTVGAVNNSNTNTGANSTQGLITITGSITVTSISSRKSFNGSGVMGGVNINGITCTGNIEVGKLTGVEASSNNIVITLIRIENCNLNTVFVNKNASVDFGGFISDLQVTNSIISVKLWICMIPAVYTLLGTLTAFKHLKCADFAFIHDNILIAAFEASDIKSDSFIVTTTGDYDVDIASSPLLFTDISVSSVFGVYLKLAASTVNAYPTARLTNVNTEYMSLHFISSNANFELRNSSATIFDLGCSLDIISETGSVENLIFNCYLLTNAASGGGTTLFNAQFSIYNSTWFPGFQPYNSITMYGYNSTFDFYEYVPGIFSGKELLGEFKTCNLKYPISMINSAVMVNTVDDPI